MGTRKKIQFERQSRYKQKQRLAASTMAAAEIPPLTAPPLKSHHTAAPQPLSSHTYPSPASAQPHPTTALPLSWPRPSQAPPRSTALLRSPVSSTPSSQELLSIHRERSKWVTRCPRTLRPSLACLLVLCPFRSCSSSRNWTPYCFTPTGLQL